MELSPSVKRAATEELSARGLELRAFGLRFVSPLDEHAYRVWRVDSSLPLIRLGMCTGLLSAILVPLAFLPWRADLAIASTPSCYGLLVPAFVVGFALLSHPPVQRFAFAVSAWLNFLPGIVLSWLAYSVLDAPGVSAVIAVLAAFYAPFMRLPPSRALLAVVPYMALANGLVVKSHMEGELALPAVLGHLLASAIALATVVVVCLIIDRLARVVYRNEQTILFQQEDLKRSRSLIRRYVPPAVADNIIDGREADIESPQRRRVTVLFADIVGFTDIADRVEPEVMTQVLSEYMSTMSNLIEEHGGTLNEFAGDGLMALFGAPDSMEPTDQASRAIAAAQAMQGSMPELNDCWRKLGLGAALQVRIGVNTGMASVGSYGSQGRMTYTAIGLQTNIASRIENAAAPGTVLISDATFQLVSDTVGCEPRGEVECPGVHYPVKVYAPVLLEELTGNRSAVAIAGGIA